MNLTTIIHGLLFGVLGSNCASTLIGEPLPNPQENVTISYKHPLPMSYGGVRIFGDDIYMLSRSTNRLVCFARDGETKVDLHLSDSAGGGSNSPLDFAVTQEGTIIVVSIVKDGAAFLVYDPNGALVGSYDIAGIADPRKIAADDQGNIWVLSVSGDTPRLENYSLEGELHESITVPSNSPSLQYYLNTTPFAVDANGNKYFQLNHGELVVVSSGGAAQHLDLPATSLDVQFISRIMPASSGVLLIVAEGNNTAPDDSPPGTFVLRGPTGRTFSLQPSTGTFSEIESGTEVARAVGYLSDGVRVDGRYTRTKGCS